jgi:hypothetical protein
VIPLDRIEAAEKAATRDPWVCTEFHTVRDLDGQLIGWPDSEFIALIRNYAADLIAVARAAQENARQNSITHELHRALAPLLSES